MNTQPFLSLLGLARRAGRLAMGHDAAGDAMQTGQGCLLILAGDLSPRTRRDMVRMAQETGTTLLDTSLSMEDIAQAVGRRTGILCTTDAGFAKKFEQLGESLFINHQPNE